MAKIRLFKNGSFIRETDAPSGGTLYGAITGAGVYLDAPCGGAGRCGKCLVRLSPDRESVRACKTYIAGDTDVYLPDDTEMTIAGSRASSDSGHAGLAGPYAAAVDIGTTTVVAHIVDIPTGARVSSAAGVNVQRGYGADVISRILYCAENGHEKLSRLVRGQVTALIVEAAAKAGLSGADITYLAVAGNTIMLHLYNGDSPVGMGQVPFAPVSLYGNEAAAKPDLHLAAGALEYLAPCVHAYVGGDITAGILASGLTDTDGSYLFLDVGTNGEMALRRGDKLYCCATAAGPAFEGAEISCGMAAVSGAVNHAEFTGGELRFDVIGGGKATGLCGSGLLDVLALLLETGAVDETGLLLPKDAVCGPIAEYIDTVDGTNAFRLSEDAFVTGGDIRKLQLAKAAIAAGIATLLSRAGLKHADGLLLAGGFGSYMSPKSAARIGLFPAELLPNTHALGNTAGEGAVLAARSADARSALSDITRRCEYVELSVDKVFTEQFIEQMMFE